MLYEINAYTDNAQTMMRLYSALHSNILDLFNEHGVQIMVPAYEGDPEQPKVVPRGQWFPAPVPNSGTVSRRRQFGRELWSGGQDLAGSRSSGVVPFGPFQIGHCGDHAHEDIEQDGSRSQLLVREVCLAIAMAIAG